MLTVGQNLEGHVDCDELKAQRLFHTLKVGCVGTIVHGLYNQQLLPSQIFIFLFTTVIQIRLALNQIFNK